MVCTLAGTAVTSYQRAHSHGWAYTGSCSYPIYTKWAISPCLFYTTGLGPVILCLKVLLGISLTFNYRQSELEVALRGTGRKLWDVRELGPADVLCLTPMSGWACSAKGSKELLESGWTAAGGWGEFSVEVACRYRFEGNIYQEKPTLRFQTCVCWFTLDRAVINKKQVHSSVCHTWKAFILYSEQLLEIDKICWGGPSLTAYCLSSKYLCVDSFYSLSWSLCR